MIFIIGCVKQLEEKLIEMPEEQINCQEYCEKQPHVMCVGNWEISGIYPDCNCKFVCETEEISKAGEEKEQEIKVQPTETEEKVSEPPITNPLDVPRVNSAAHLTLVENEKIVEEEDTPALCYLGAFAMLVLFDNPSLDFADVATYSGIGSAASYDSRTGLINKYKEKSIILAAQNFGYDYVLGVKSGGKANSHLASFTPSASEVKYFKDEEEAFSRLKQIIDSGKPVEVHLDVYYVIDDFRKISDMWVRAWDKGHWSHFMTVTGYDDNYVYINDPTDPDLNIKNMKTPVKNFLEAWKNGDKIIGGAQLGPYWMLYINKKGNKKSVSDIISWNKEASTNAASSIRSARSGDNSELGVGRKEFGKFLERNGYNDAGKLYKEAADIYLEDPEDYVLYKEIAQKEEEARGLLE